MKLYEENTLSKKLKRRIQELCGFNQLEREQKIVRANEILNSSDLKQAICHQILGTTHKDVEKAMLAVLNERQLTPAQEEELELREAAPHKFDPDFDPDFEFKVNNRVTTSSKEKYRPLTREECAKLLAASNSKFEPAPAKPQQDYPTYTRDQVQELLRDYWEYKAKQHLKKEEAEWDLQKTTESEPKTENIKKPSISTKD